MEDLTTSDVPPEYLEDAFLVGHLPFRALQVGPRVSSCLYIPPAHYRTYAQPNTRALPLIVNVRGTERRAERCCVSLGVHGHKGC